MHPIVKKTISYRKKACFNDKGVDQSPVTVDNAEGDKVKTPHQQGQAIDLVQSLDAACHLGVEGPQPMQLSKLLCKGLSHCDRVRNIIQSTVDVLITAGNKPQRHKVTVGADYNHIHGVADAEAGHEKCPRCILGDKKTTSKVR